MYTWKYCSEIVCVLILSKYRDQCTGEQSVHLPAFNLKVSRIAANPKFYSPNPKEFIYLLGTRFNTDFLRLIILKQVQQRINKTSTNITKSLGHLIYTITGKVETKLQEEVIIFWKDET